MGKLTFNLNYVYFLNTEVIHAAEVRLLGGVHTHSNSYLEFKILQINADMRAIIPIHTRFGSNMITVNLRWGSIAFIRSRTHSMLEKSRQLGV